MSEVVGPVIGWYSFLIETDSMKLRRKKKSISQTVLRFDCIICQIINTLRTISLFQLRIVWMESWFWIRIVTPRIGIQSLDTQISAFRVVTMSFVSSDQRQPLGVSLHSALFFLPASFRLRTTHPHPRANTRTNTNRPARRTNQILPRPRTRARGSSCKIQLC